MSISMHKSKSNYFKNSSTDVTYGFVYNFLLYATHGFVYNFLLYATHSFVVHRANKDGGQFHEQT